MYLAQWAERREQRGEKKTNLLELVVWLEKDSVARDDEARTGARMWKMGEIEVASGEQKAKSTAVFGAAEKFR